MRSYLFVCFVIMGCISLNGQQTKVLKSGYAKMKEGHKVEFSSGQIKEDHLHIISSGSNKQTSIMLQDIELIQHRLRSKAGQGLGLGLAVGGGISLLAVLNVTSDSSSRLKDNWYVPLLGLTAVSGLIGALTGSTRYHVETIYEPSSLSGYKTSIGIETNQAIGPKFSITF